MRERKRKKGRKEERKKGRKEERKKGRKQQTKAFLPSPSFSIISYVNVQHLYP